MDNIKIDWATGKVSGDVNHFTKFAVLATEKSLVELTDITGHWAEENIVKLVGLDTISGYPDGSFKPNNQITRAEFITIVVRALGLESKGHKVFADTTYHWAKDVIATANEHKIINGYRENNFGEGDPITREQMAAIIVNAFELNNGTGTTFKDQLEVSAWAKDAIEKASSNSFITGYEDGTFRPKNNATRAEAVTVIVRALEKE